MVLNLRRIFQPSRKDLTIVARNHRDQAMTFLAPFYLEYIDFSRWLDSGGRCTELCITAFDGRSATIFLEDNNWHLIVSGGIRGGRKAIKVNGSHDFDVKFTNEGHVLLECWNKSGWGPGTGTILQLELPALSDIDAA